MSHKHSLAEFVEKIFLAIEVTDASANYRWQCRRAVKAFSGSLGRPAGLADLTPGHFKQFADWLPEHEPESQHQLIRKRLRSIWRYAALLGLADPVDEYQRPKKAKPKPVMTPGTVSHFFEEVYLPERLVGATKECIDDYRRKIRQFDRFVGHPVMLSELSDALVAAFFNDQSNAGLRSVTVNRTRAHLFAIWRLAVDRGKVDRQPAVRKLREAYDEPDAWTEGEFRLILSKCGSLGGQLGGLPAPVVVRAVLLLAYWTGLRRRALRTLKWANVDMDERWVTVPGDLMKNRRGKKYRFGADAAEALQAVRIRGVDTVLPPLDWKRFYNYFDRLLELAGIPPSSRRVMTKLHKVRRTTATMVAMRQGLGAASSLLGHRAEEVTLRYIDPSQLPGNDMTNVLPMLSTEEGGAA